MTVIMLVDCSGSTASIRDKILDAARQEMPTDSSMVRLIGFDHDTQVFDEDSVIGAINKLHSLQEHYGGTDVTKAIGVALGLAKPGDKLVLVTDNGPDPAELNPQVKCVRV